jgi:hypothetical protein
MPKKKAVLKKDHPLYKVWGAMKTRCTNPKHVAYQRYGGRGISVDPRWLNFDNFVEDVFPTFKPGLELDRVDNDKGYSANNCRWCSRKANARNRKDNRIIDTPWGAMPVAEAADRAGIPYITFAARIARGDIGDHLFRPVKTKQKQQREPVPVDGVPLKQLAQVTGLSITGLKHRLRHGDTGERLLRPAVRYPLIDTPWGRLSIAKAAKMAGLEKDTLRCRINAGMSSDRWFLPVDELRKRKAA